MPKSKVVIDQSGNRYTVSKYQKKQFCQAVRVRQPEPVIEKRERINKAVFMQIVRGLQDARPIKTSEHYPYKDAQHRECVLRVGRALAETVRGKNVSISEYVIHFNNLVRDELYIEGNKNAY